jgi:hypothetical protein
MFIHCMYMFILYIYMYMGTTYYINILLWYIYHSCLVCTALVIGMYYAIVQELVILYIEVSDWDRPPRNG